MSIEQFDALLYLSFGGPEGPEDVVPFLRNVTRGRNIPDERLEEVGEHYYHFGGKSPINDQNLKIISNLKELFAERGIDLPIYFGNRNWHPLAEDTAKKIFEDGVRNVLVFATSAWGGYSGCLQYHEDIRRMREVCPEINFTKLPQFFSHELFIDEMSRAVKEAQEELPGARLVFTAHSVPTAADARAGGEGDKHLYSRQVAESSQLVARAAGVAEYDVVWQSRSGSPRTPWLEPDVCDHAEELAGQGIKEFIICPIGFISDHMEVIWDLDTELVETADKLGMKLVRTRTAGLSERFADMVFELAEEASVGAIGSRAGSVTVQGCTLNGDACRPGCCSQA